jgi:hypothetical protein
VQDLPSIVEAYRTSGENDYFLRGVVSGFDGLERLISEPVLVRAGITVVESAIGLRQCITGPRISGVWWASGSDGPQLLHDKAAPTRVRVAPQQ